MARAEITLDWTYIDNCLMAGVTQKRLAESIGVHPETINNHCLTKKSMSFSDYSAKQRSKGLSLLEATQFKKALEGNQNMLLWLGKVKLGQVEVPHEESKPPLDLLVDKDNENMILKAEIANLSKQLEAMKVKNDHQPEAGQEFSRSDAQV